MFVLAAFLIGLVVVIINSPFNLAERGDLAIWDYVSQSILRGQIPYRDVIEIKTPLSAYMSATAIAAGRLVGAEDVLVTRLFSAIQIGLLSAVTYLVAAVHLRNRLASMIAFLIPLLAPHLVVMVAGTQPKLPMIFFGMLALLSIAKDRPFGAGLFSMLSFLCWQPGLLFTGTAVLIFSGCLTSWRDLRAAKVLAGAAIPLAVVVVYFYLVGALSDFWTWTVAFNFEVYAPRGIKGLRDALALIWTESRQVFGPAVIFIPISGAGLLAFAFRLIRELNGPAWRRYGKLIPLSLVIPSLVYLAFCLINFQGGPDLIPLFPFIGIFAAWLLAEAARWIASTRFAVRWLSSSGALKRTPALAVVLLLSVFVLRTLNNHAGTGKTLAEQRREFQLISDTVALEERIYVHGTLEILVLLNRPNLDPYIMFDQGKDDYVADRRYNGSFQEFLMELGTKSPKVISLSRLRRVTHGSEFKRWVLRGYELLPVGGYDNIYVRKQ